VRLRIGVADVRAEPSACGSLATRNPRCASLPCSARRHASASRRAGTTQRPALGARHSPRWTARRDFDAERLHPSLDAELGRGIGARELGRRGEARRGRDRDERVPPRCLRMTPSAARVCQATAILPGLRTCWTRFLAFSDLTQRMPGNRSATRSASRLQHERTAIVSFMHSCCGLASGQRRNDSLTCQPRDANWLVA
jgi:hypothetical protein